MKASAIQNLINHNCNIQKTNPPDSDAAQQAVLENRELFAYCERMGWRYNTDGGYLTIIATEAM